MMPNRSSNITLLPHKGNFLTQEEIDLLAVFEKREADKQKEIEEQKKKMLQMASLVSITSIKSASQEPIRRFSHLSAGKRSSTGDLKDSEKKNSSRDFPGEKKKSIGEDDKKLLRMDMDLELFEGKDENDSVALESATSFTEGDVDISTKSYKKSKLKEDENIPITPKLTQEEQMAMIPPLLNEDWCPQQNIDKKLKPKQWKLESFGLDAYQTLICNVTVPESSKRWSINIGPPETPRTETAQYDYGAEETSAVLSTWTEILLHFNPRYTGKKIGLILNDKQGGVWGQATLLPSSGLPKMLGTSFEFMIQISAAGFGIFINKACVAVFDHSSKDLPQHNSLMLELALVDDYEVPEVVTFHQVWWGRLDPVPIPESLISKKAKMAQREGTLNTIFITGFPKMEDREACLELEDGLWSMFEAYSVQRVKVIAGKGFGFIALDSNASALQAVREMNNIMISDDTGTDSFTLRVKISTTNLGCG